MAYQCVNASTQYFTFPALGVSVAAGDVQHLDQYDLDRRQGHRARPLARFGQYRRLPYLRRRQLGIALLCRRRLAMADRDWPLRRHGCVATRMRRDQQLAGQTLPGWRGFTNNVSHALANINEAGDLARDPFPDAAHTATTALAEAAIWTATLSDAECRRLVKAPIALATQAAAARFGVLQRPGARSQSGRRAGTHCGQRAGRRPASAGDLSLWPAAKQFSACHFISPYRHATASAHTSQPFAAAPNWQGRPPAQLIPSARYPANAAS